MNTNSYNLDAGFIAEHQDFRLDDSLEDESKLDKIANYIGMYGGHVILIIVIIILIALVSRTEQWVKDCAIIVGAISILSMLSFGVFYRKNN